MCSHQTLSDIHSIFCSVIEGRRRIADEGGGGGRHWIVSCCHRRRGRASTGAVATLSDPIRSAFFNPSSPVPRLRVSSASPHPPLRQQQQPSGGGGGGGDDRHDYYVNLGHAIRSLREDYPVVFYKDPDLSIYRDDVVFVDPLHRFDGIDNYKCLFSCLRLIGPVLFDAPWVDITSILQPAESTVVIRWTVHAVPRVPWASRGLFGGVSVYRLDREGKIYEHRVDNLARNPPVRFKVAAVEDLIRSLGFPAPPRPTYFESSLSSIRSMPFLLMSLIVGCNVVLNEHSFVLELGKAMCGN